MSAKAGACSGPLYMEGPATWRIDNSHIASMEDVSHACTRFFTAFPFHRRV